MIVVVGLSHRSAPIGVREELAFSDEDLLPVLQSLAAEGPVGEALAVSTCNRMEFVAAPREAVRADLPRVATAVLERVCALRPRVRPHLYVHSGTAAVRHLFRVAASLDSLVIGEPQILGQVKQAYDFARAAGTTGPTLNRIVPRAIRSAKRVRTETNIGGGQVSVPSVAVDLAQQIFGDLRRHTAALVGSGDMGESVARLLSLAGARLIVVGRNAARVGEIAGELNAEGRSIDALDATLVEADVVVTATSARGYVAEYERVAKNRKARKGRSLFFIDLAVPRDVDPRVEGLDGVFLYNVDDLSKVVAETLSSREREAERAETIVQEEVRGYDRWVEAEQVTPLIVALRERLRAVLESEIERSLNGRLRHLSAAEREGLSRMTEATLNKMLHYPTIRLREMAADSAARADLEQYLAVLSHMFGLTGAPSTPPAADDEADDLESSSDGRPVREMKAS